MAPKIRTFYVKVCDLNRKNVVVCTEHILNVAKIKTVTSCAGKHMTSLSFLTLVLPSRWVIFKTFFHAVNIAIEQQYCYTVRPQLRSDRHKHGGSIDCFLNDNIWHLHSLSTDRFFKVGQIRVSERLWSCIFRNCSQLGLKMYIFLTVEFILL